MPPIAWVFIALFGFAHGHTVATQGWPAADRVARPQGMKPTAITYTVTTAPWMDSYEDKKGGCDFQLLARVTGRGPVRARINMVEQLLDESWSPRFRIKAGERAIFDVEFLEPIGPDYGFTIIEKSTTFTCRARTPGAFR
jgi:hypothetical protein